MSWYAHADPNLVTSCLTRHGGSNPRLAASPTTGVPTFDTRDLTHCLSCIRTLPCTQALVIVLVLIWQRHALKGAVWREGIDESALPGADANANRRRGLRRRLSEEEAASTLEERIERAAEYVHDALAGRFRGVHWAVGSQSTALRRIHAQRLLRGLRNVRGLNILLYLAIPFFEQPSWCYAQKHCGNATEVMLTDLPHAPVGVTQGLEFICILGFAAEMGLKLYCMSPRNFFASPWHVIQMMLLLFNASLVLIQSLSSSRGEELLDKPQAGVFDYLNPMLRPLFFIAISRTVRRAARSFIRVVTVVYDMLWLIALLVLTYAMLGTLCFGFSDSAELDPQFGSVERAVQTMFILLTTSNFPDVMLPVYKDHKGAWVFFASFLILGVVLFMNLLLATFVRQFREQKVRLAVSQTGLKPTPTLACFMPLWLLNSAHTALAADLTVRSLAQQLSAEKLARARRDCAFEASFMLLDLNCNGFSQLTPPHISPHLLPSMTFAHLLPADP